MNHNLTRRSLKFIIILILLSLCSISQVRSQSLNFADYGGKFIVKPGASMQYKFTTINVPHFNYYNQSFYLQNGTIQRIKLTQGTLVTIIVTNISTSPYTYILGNEKILTPTGKTFNVENVSVLYTISYLIPSFDNQSILNSFLDALNKQDSNLYNYRCDNTYIYIHFLNSYPDNTANGYNVNLTNTIDEVANWHTGWLKSQDMTSKYSNGTIVSSVKIERVTNNQIDQIINTGTNLAVIIIPIMVIAIAVFAFISYKKNNLSRANSPNKNSFSHYLATNFKKQKQKSNPKKIQIDKSLEIIDDILKDSENG